MAHNRKDRQEAVDDSGELVQQEGKWYKRVSAERAWSISKDIQLYIRVHRATSHLVRMPRDWKDPDHDWFVEVEPNKEEYTPNE